MKTSEKLADIKTRLLPPQFADANEDVRHACLIDHICESPIKAAISLGYGYIGAEIHVRMNGYTTMRRWLIDYVGIDEAQVTPFRAQNHCLHWMDELIKEFKAKGD